MNARKTVTIAMAAAVLAALTGCASTYTLQATDHSNPIGNVPLRVESLEKDGVTRVCGPEDRRGVQGSRARPLHTVVVRTRIFGGTEISYLCANAQ